MLDYAEEFTPHRLIGGLHPWEDIKKLGHTTLMKRESQGGTTIDS
jgi:hypothetical protein